MTQGFQEKKTFIASQGTRYFAYYKLNTTMHIFIVLVVCVFVQHQQLYVDLLAWPGATEHNIEDFWRMIWQENISIIVMTTKLMENMKVSFDLFTRGFIDTIITLYMYVVQCLLQSMYMFCMHYLVY